MARDSLTVSSRAVARMMGRRPSWTNWLVSAITIALGLVWAVPIAWATIVSLRPPGDSLGRGDIWFSSRITAESYERATALAPFFPSWNALSAEQFAARFGVSQGAFAVLGAVALLAMAALIVAATRRWGFSGRTTAFLLGAVAAIAALVGLNTYGSFTTSYYSNTIQFVVLTIVVQMVTVTLAGFAFAHFNFVGRRLLFTLILLQMMIPTAVLLVPNFVTVREFSTEMLLIPRAIYYHKFSLYDTPLAMAMPYFGSAMGTFLMRQAFLGVPRDLVDAGVVDGCRWYHLLRHVYLPPSWPSLIAWGLVSTSFHWNELLWPLVITSDRARPLTMGLLRFTQLTDIGAQWSLVMAATMIIVLPLLVAFLIFQRQFISSFLHSGLK